MPVVVLVVSLLYGLAQDWDWEPADWPARWGPAEGCSITDTRLPALWAAQSSPAAGADSWPWGGGQQPQWGPMIVFAVGIALFLGAYLFVRAQPSTKKKKKKKHS